MRKANFRNLWVLAIAGLMLVLVPASARADFLDFTVVEGTVPGNFAFTFTADKLNGGYSEVISFDGAGNFSASAYADFGQYYKNEGATAINSQLGSLYPPELDYGYNLYAVFISDGTVSGTTFTGDLGEIHVWIDPDQDTTKSLTDGYSWATLGNDSDDYEIMWTDTLLMGIGTFEPSADKGSFNFIFGDPNLTTAGNGYWPTLQYFVFTATVDGDFDTFEVPAGPGIIEDLSGDVSAVFTVVPEPGTLVLLGIGLVGAALAVRRKA